MANDLSRKVAVITGAREVSERRSEKRWQRAAAIWCSPTSITICSMRRLLRFEPPVLGSMRGSSTCAMLTAVQALVDGAFRDLGRVDYLFNNAGVNLCAELRDTTLEDWDLLIDMNLRGVIHGVHAAYPIMREQGFGHIVNIASAAGLIPAAAEGAYAATKHAVVGLSSSLRIEAESFGVKVSVVCPV